MAMDVDSDPEPLHAPSLKHKKLSVLLSSNNNDDRPSKDSKPTPPQNKAAVTASSSKPKPKAKLWSSISISSPVKGKVKSRKKV